MFGNKSSAHADNTARQLETPEFGQRHSTAATALKGTEKYTGVRYIPLERVMTRKQVRESFDEAKIQELADSFIATKQHTPCIVFWSEDDQKFVIVAGERRFRAAQKANFDKLLCDVLDREPSEEELHEIQLVENVQREDLSPIEEAKGYQRFIDDFGWSQAQIAKKTGKNQSNISRALKLMKLPAEILEELQRIGGPKTLAEKLVRLGSLEEQQEMLERYERGELNTRQAQEETSKGGSKKTAAKQVRVKKIRGIDYRAAGKKKHNSTDFTLGAIDWVEDLATDKRSSVDVHAVKARLQEVLSKLDSSQELRAA